MRLRAKHGAVQDTYQAVILDAGLREWALRRARDPVPGTALAQRAVRGLDGVRRRRLLRGHELLDAGSDRRHPHGAADAPWHLYVLNLRTGHETALSEPRSVDDQAVWHDDRTLTYALPGDYGADLYTIPADGTGTPRRISTAAVSPAYIG